MVRNHTARTPETDDSGPPDGQPGGAAPADVEPDDPPPPAAGRRAAGSPEPAAVERALKRLRDNIDQVDGVLVKLLNQRARWALEIGDVKKEADIPVYQPDREKKVLDRVQSQNRGPLGEAAMQRLFERIIDESRRLERLGGEGEGPASAAAGGPPVPGGEEGR